MLVRRHFEALVFCYLAEELCTGDVAVIGSEEYADWSRQLLSWETVEAELRQCLVDVGLREARDARPSFDAAAFTAELREKLTAAAAADGGYPDGP
jgi:hypothetical protein